MGVEEARIYAGIIIDTRIVGIGCVETICITEDIGSIADGVYEEGGTARL